jgi:single-strand DNA-binding protein
MANFNRVILVGNLVRDIELRYLQNGTAVADGRIAVNDSYKSGDKQVETTSFIDLTLWNKQAELAVEYTKKGSPVLVEGRLKQDSWETAEGEKRSKLIVVVEKIQFLAKKAVKDESPQNKEVTPPKNDVIESAAPPAEKSNEEVPF